jgi:hypothetical protein
MTWVMNQWCFVQNYLILENNMWEKPQFDPYDAIVQLDAKCQVQEQQILKLAHSQNTQAKTIENLITSIRTLQSAHLQLSELVTSFIDQTEPK